MTDAFITCVIYLIEFGYETVKLGSDIFGVEFESTLRILDSLTDLVLAFNVQYKTAICPCVLDCSV